MGQIDLAIQSANNPGNTVAGLIFQAVIPGTHTIGFDGPSDTIELTHTARDRRGFAAGALVAARWVQGKVGWYSMQDVLKG